MDSIMKHPLVSVGIPTYNRPQTLRRTLNSITGQSYQHLEIIVSDNCSPGEETQNVIMEFMQHDNRIQSFCQKENMGPAFNWKFVLKEARGEYFMWASDDDEWDKYFIETCLSNIGQCSTAMCKIRTSYTQTGLSFELPLPDLSPDYSKYKNYKESILNPVPGLIYGLHRRSDILWSLDADAFDFADCFFISKLIIEGDGISLIRDYCGYIACIIETERYCYKSFKPQANRCFQYGPYIQSHFNLITNSPFSFFQKQFLKLLVLWRAARWFTKYEKKYKPIRIWLLKILIMRSIRTLIKFINAFKKNI